MGVFRRALAVIYGRIVALRGWLYDHGIVRSYRSPIPVVCVGNVTAGGNGKTPLCLAIAKEMQRRGYSPAILSRGYGGALRGPHRVSSADSFHDVGDEAVLMAKTGVPVFVSRKRVKGIKLIEQDHSINFVILDDGFQHRALARSLDIVSVFVGSASAVGDFIAGELLPFGLFREPRDTGLRRAQMVVLSYRAVPDSGKLAPVDPRLSAVLPASATVFRSYLTPLGVTRLVSGDSVQPGRVCALAAIANPEGFFNSLENLGFSLSEKFAFPDHHVFTESELRQLFAEHPNEDFVCTEKDAVKLRELPDYIRARCAVLAVSAEIVPSDAFFVQIERAIQGAPGQLKRTDYQKVKRL